MARSLSSDCLALFLSRDTSCRIEPSPVAPTAAPSPPPRARAETSPRDDTRDGGASSSTSERTALRSRRPMSARALGSNAGGSNLRVASAATLASSSRSSLTSILVPSLGRPSGRRSNTSAGDGASHDGPWGSPGSAGAPTDTTPDPNPVPAADRLSATSARLSAVVTRRSNSIILLLASASSASARRALSSAANALSSTSPPPRLSGTGSLSGTGAVCVRGGGG